MSLYNTLRLTNAEESTLVPYVLIGNIIPALFSVIFRRPSVASSCTVWPSSIVVNYILSVTSSSDDAHRAKWRVKKVCCPNLVSSPSKVVSQTPHKEEKNKKIEVLCKVPLKYCVCSQNERMVLATVSAEHELPTVSLGTKNNLLID